MPRLNISTPQRIYTVSSDNTVRPADRLKVYISGQFLDEITLAPPLTPVQLTVSIQYGPGRDAVLEPLFVTRVTSESLFAVAGMARQRFSGLDLHPCELVLTASAPGYLSIEVPVTVPQVPGFPDDLPAELHLGKLELRREPVVIAGRVVTTGTTPTPVAGATVRLTGLWKTMVLAGAGTAADPPNLVGVQGPLFFPRAITGPTAGQALEATIVDTGADKRLQIPVAPGKNPLSLDNRTGLNPAGGDFLWIDTDDPAEGEFVLTDRVFGGATADQPAQVTLAYGTRKPHRRGAVVKLVTVTTSGSNKLFTRDGTGGDTAVFVNDLTGWETATAIRVSGGATAECHSITHFSALTDPAGFYRLPPINRVAQVNLEAKKGGATGSARWSLDYNQPINQVDFHL